MKFDIFEQLAVRLRHVPLVPVADTHKTRAAVAMIVSSCAQGLELLFIVRAAHELDPWSGHIAFPGGKLEEGEKECEAAGRETFEEVGIDLNDAVYLGRLSDIVGLNLPVQVSCCVFGLERTGFTPVLSDEVKEVFWIALEELADKNRHVLSPVIFGERTMEVPAIALTYPPEPVLWGITHRLVMQFLEIVSDENRPVDISFGPCTLPDTINITEEEKP